MTLDSNEIGAILPKNKPFIVTDFKRFAALVVHKTKTCVKLVTIRGWHMKCSYLSQGAPLGTREESHGKNDSTSHLPHSLCFDGIDAHGDWNFGSSVDLTPTLEKEFEVEFKMRKKSVRVKVIGKVRSASARYRRRERDETADIVPGCFPLVWPIF